MSEHDQSVFEGPAIAIIGMSGRFPGAADLDQFWSNLRDGVESISHYRPDQLNPPDLRSGAVGARSVLDGVDRFDPAFFGIYPKEAALMDPQHRVFLEICWEAMERAGYCGARYEGSVGVFAGCSMNTYFMRHVAGTREYLQEFTQGYQVDNYLAMLGNDKDFLPTRVSYKLGLRGPSISIGCACSTSLVAICQAAQSLLNYGCDMALAGGASITFPQHRSYVAQEGAMVSEDGHLYPFDERAQGTVFGSGAGVVLLKRLDDAVADGDPILGVIRGFAVNNDGAGKVGYVAPSVEGQSECIMLAHGMAGVPAESITYIEAHGTATPMGDPIEVAALNRAFRASTDAVGFCCLGTSKANLGHLDVAAGVIGLIKVLLMMKHRELPPLIHYEKPNPRVEFEGSPFYVNQAPTRWKSGEFPLRAGISAFGVGGTNAHVVVEEAPVREASSASKPAQLLVWSAKTATAADAQRLQLARHFESHPNLNLADAAFTLQRGRIELEQRRALVAKSREEAIAALQTGAGVLQVPVLPSASARVAFLFPGQGAQFTGMGRALFESEPVFRDTILDGARRFQRFSGEDLLSVLYPGTVNNEAEERIHQTRYAQPALFLFEYALAKLWMSWGIVPAAMVGHSVGEYVAACLADVLSLDDALRLIAIRGKSLQELPGGAMLAVRLPEEQLLPRLAGRLDLAAVNGPGLCVVSGPFDPIEALEKELTAENIPHRRLATSHAFHSAMVEPMLESFRQEVRKTSLRQPRIPVYSTLTGRLAEAGDLTDPEYWVRQVRCAVRFGDAVAPLRAEKNLVLLEVGPAETLVQAVRQPGSSQPLVLASLAHRRDQAPEDVALLQCLGKLWCAGLQPDWQALHGEERRHRVELPSYPFEKKRYWADSHESETASAASAAAGTAPVSSAFASAPSSATAALSVLISNPVDFREEIPLSVDDRKPALFDELKNLLSDLSGLDVAQLDPVATFLELGFDSLFITQYAQAVQAKFKQKLTFRQLMERYSSLDALVNHLDSVLPESAYRQPAPAPAPVPAVAAPVPAVPASPAPVASAPALMAPAAPVPVPAFAPTASTPPAPMVSGSGLEALFAHQVQAMNDLMARQLDLLRGVPAAALTAPSIPVAPVMPAVPAPMAAPAPAVPLSAPSASSPAAPAPAAVESKTQEFKAFGPYKPIQRGQTGDVTPAQQRYIDNLMARYTEKTKSSKRLTQQHRAHLADPRVVSGFRQQWKEMVYPIVTTKSDGAYLWDADGNRYIDILNGFGCILFGHRPKFVLDAIQHQAGLGFEIGPQTLLAGEVADQVCRMTGHERATFCNTGSEAVMAAMRLARTVTGRDLIVYFAGDYHGTFDEVLVKAGGKGKSMPIAPGIPRGNTGNILVLEYGTQETLDYIRNHADDFAAVLTEPVQSRHPGLQPKAFLQEVRRITEKAGTALIMDEVVTGFRTHPGGVQALFDVKADLASYGKVIGGGLPIGVLAGSREYMDALDGGMWSYGDDSFPEVGVTFFAGTFVRHPLTLAAVQACLTHLEQEGTALQEGLTRKAERFAAELNSLFREFHAPSHAEQFSSWLHFTWPSDARFASLLYYSLREKGIHIQEGFPCYLTTAHTDAVLDEVIAGFRSVLKEMDEAGMFAGMSDGVEAPSGHHAPALASAPVAAPTPAVPVAPAAHVAEPEQDEAPVVEPDPLPEAPITEEQKEIFLATQMGDDANCAFNESTTLYLKGQVDLNLLVASFRAVVDRHDALRATFTAEGDRIRFASLWNGGLTRHDFSSFPPAQAREKFAELTKQESATPFDLVNGPLFRAHLVRLDADNVALLFTAHHMVVDGWSANVIFDEVGRLYSAQRSGVAVKLDPRMPYSRFAERQHHRAATEEGKAVESYWLSQYQTLNPPLEIPTDRPRPAVRTYNGSTRRRVFSPDLYQSVKKAGAKQGCTLFATLLSSFSLLLHRLTGQDDVVIGIPAAGQSAVADYSLVGHCVNFLPLRSRIGDQQPLSNFLSQTRQTLLNAFDNQDYTYGSLLQKLRVPRDPSRLPLVEVQFNVEKIGAGLRYQGLEAHLDSNGKSFVNMDLFFNFVENGSDLLLDCDYNTDLFDEATIDRWFDLLETIMRAWSEDLNRSALQVPLLTAAATEQILNEWNRTATAYPRNASIQSLFEEKAAAQPQAIALSLEGRTLTYGELNTRANQLAAQLRQWGIGPEMPVAISMERSFELIVAVLATIKSGGFYVPIDAQYPEARRQLMLDDTRASVILTQAKFESNFAHATARVVAVDRDAVQWSALSAVNLPITVTADSAAYMIYTSGSTGTPKGVVVPHRAVVRLVRDTDYVELSEREVLLQLASISFDASTFEVWGALLNGAKLVILPPAPPAPEDIGATIAQNGVTTLWLTAGLFHLMAASHLDALRPLRQLLAGGDVLSPVHVRNVLEAIPGLRLINGYGPTENTTFTCCHTITLESVAHGTVPIGKPIANTQVYLLDRWMQPVPVGVAGFLYTGGDGLAKGYWNAPELTQQKFVADPFHAGQRLYATGDLARWRADGTIEFLGRADTQVKIRGYRIELGEIESVLESNPLVKQSAVMAREDNPGDRRLAAYVVPQAGAAAETLIAELRSFLKDRLPEYMQPASITVLEQIPTTSNGKVDRRALPAPQADARALRRDIIAPRNMAEETLAGIWRRVLKVDEVSVEDSVFELGGDSLLIFQISTLSNQAGLAINPKHVFQYRTIAGLAQMLEGNQNSGTVSPAKGGIVAVSRAGHKRVRPAAQDLEVKQ